MSSEEAEYYHRRSIAETELAYAATTKGAARRHAELALRFLALQEQAEGRTPSEIPAPAVNEVRPDVTSGVLWNGMSEVRQDC